MKNDTKFWQSLLVILIIGGLTFFPVTASAAGTIVYEQSPGHFGGFLSDGQVFTVADEFQFDQATLITHITWWGGYGSPYLPIPLTDNFTIWLYADNGGQPSRPRSGL